MDLGTLSPAKGARRNTKRRGRGLGTGNGGTAGRGHKGQNCRSGGGVRRVFEGGQTPMTRRIPKRGFRHQKRHPVQAVGLRRLNVFESGAVVGIEEMLAKGLVDAGAGIVKILATGDIEKPLTVKAHRFTNGAKSKIEAAGGAVEVLE
ncbi:50S ribosomal protein L15 [Candidatus Hydrogenedentota bacterium]